MTEHLIRPHGGELVDLMVDERRRLELLSASRDYPSWDLTPRQICDLELLLTGGFSPLRGFMNRRDFESVCKQSRLADGTLWPMPIVLEVAPAVAQGLDHGAMLALRDSEGVMLAVLEVDEVFVPAFELEADHVFGTRDATHPGVAHLLRHRDQPVVAGRVHGVQLPTYYDYVELRHTPKQLRAEFARLGWRTAVAFQTRNPLHRAHYELTLRAAKEVGANLLIHPVVGLTKPGDLDHYTRVRCYQELLRHYPKHTATLSLLPLAMRMAGPREAVWHAIIRKNCGCTHFIVGRDHAGPGNDAQGRPFYGPYDAQELVRRHQQELGIAMVPFKNMVYVEERGSYEPDDEVAAGTRTLSLSGTELRRRLQQGLDVPEWFTFPEVANELRRTHPPRTRQGFTVFFSGLSGAGKSTIARALMVKMLEIGGRPVTLLDGDLVRKHLSSELGFSKEHRDINVRRIGYVASEITKNGGIAICAPIAPYASVRGEVRQMIEPLGGFALVYVSTPIAVCETRDRKGLYAKARAGLIPGFTGVSDPYEEPADAELRLDTSDLSCEESVQQILLHLEREGYLGVP